MCAEVACFVTSLHRTKLCRIYLPAICQHLTNPSTSDSPPSTMPPTHVDFEAFEIHLIHLDLVGCEAHRNAVVQRFPNPADRLAFASWAAMKISNRTVR